MSEFNYIECQATITSHEVDQFGRIKPFVLLNIGQEAAYAHSQILGFGYDNLMPLGLAWVLSRAQIKIERTPRWGEKLIIRTWHKRQDRAFSLRDYLVFDEQGEIIIRMTTSWLVMNIANRRIHRVESLLKDNELIDFNSFNEDAIEAPAPKVEISTDECEMLDSHRVRFSDLDLNRHTNNAKYIEWAVDRIPSQMDESLTLKELSINFNLESKHGDIVDLKSYTERIDSQQSVTVDGSRDGKSIFVANFKYTEN